MSDAGACVTLCLDCGTRRSGIGGALCLVCGSAALELRAGHVFQPTALLEHLGCTECKHCGASPPLREGRFSGGQWFGVGGVFGSAHFGPDCETTQAQNLDLGFGRDGWALPDDPTWQFEPEQQSTAGRTI